MPGRVIGWLLSDMSPEQRRTTLRVVCWGLIGTLAWTVGLVPGVEAQFARAGDVDKKISEAVQPIKTQVEEIDSKLSRVEREVIAARIVSLEESLFSLRKSQCTAISRQNTEATEFYGRRMQRLSAQYHDATGRAYQPPSCAEVGVE